MIAIPAVDVLDHKVVQLVGGVPGSQQVVLPDIAKTADHWVSMGAPCLHLVDLDAAFGKPDNSDAFCEVIASAGVPCEVGGGIRSESQIAKYLDAGADRIIVGTKAIKEPEWFAEMARKFPGKLILGMDTKGGKISIKGWQEEVYLSIDKDVLDRTWARTDWSQGTYSLDVLKGWLDRLLRLDVVAVDVCGGLSPAQGAKPQDLRVNGDTDMELQDWILACLER